MTDNEETQLPSLPPIQDDKHLSVVLYSDLESHNSSNVYATVREYVRRYGYKFPVSEIPDRRELIVATLFDIYKVLREPKKYAEEVDKISEWIELYDYNVLFHEPFRIDYLEGIRELLTRPTDERYIEAARKIARVINVPLDSSEMLADSLTSILFLNPSYAIRTLRSIGAEDRLHIAEKQARTTFGNVRLSHSEIERLNRAKSVLWYLGIDANDTEEYKRLVEIFHGEFQESVRPYDLLYVADRIKLEIDKEMLLRTAMQEFADEKSVYRAAEKAMALKMFGCEIGEPMSELVEIAVRPSKHNFGVIRQKNISLYTRLVTLRKIRNKVKKSLEKENQ